MAGWKNSYIVGNTIGKASDKMRKNGFWRNGKAGWRERMDSKYLLNRYIEIIYRIAPLEEGR